MEISRDEVSDVRNRRKQRILSYITQDPPVPLKNIVAMEGATTPHIRVMIQELEEEHGIKYLGTIGVRQGGDMPYGLTDATNRLRANLATELYQLTCEDNDFGFRSRRDVAPVVGMHNREQIRAENKPFTHDWTLSQIERLANHLGEDPREFLLRCLTN